MVKHTQTIRRLLSTNSLSVFHYFMGLALEGLKLLSICILILAEASFKMAFLIGLIQSLS